MTFDQKLRGLIDEYLAGKNCGFCCSANIWAFYSTLDLKDAIMYACDYGKVNVGGTIYEDDHFSKLDSVSLKSAEEKLLSITKQLSKANSFKQIYDLVRGVTEDVKGINRMFYYDASVRIAASIGNGRADFLPKDVFYQRGAEWGAVKIGILTEAGVNEKEPYLPYEKFIRVSSEFKRLRPHQIEDFLCIFHNKLDLAK